MGQCAQEGIAISRGQQQQVLNTASSQNATNFGNAQSAFGQTQNDVGDYTNALNKYVSANPYVQGGQYDQTINAGLANTSDAGANSLAGALQSQAKRTGMNSAADAATASSMAQANTRSLSADQAAAQQQRIGSDASYNQTALNASATPAQLESGLYGTSGSQGNQELSTQESAAQTPSFWDEVGSGLTQGLGGALGGTSYNTGTGNWNIGGGGGGGRGCWIAAELYGGFYETRTILVRNWLHTEFTKHLFGRVVVALYMRFGERTADLIRRFPTLRRVFLPVFNAALAKAKAWDESFSGEVDVPLGQSRQVQAAMKRHQEFELKLQADADRLFRSQIGAHLQRLGYDASESLVLEIALKLFQKFNENALLTAKMDEIRKLPQGPESRRLRLSMLRKVTHQFLPGVLVEAFPRAKLPELSTGVNERPAAVRTEIPDAI